jgi:hypothetical protein
MPSQQDILQLLHEIRDADDEVSLEVLAGTLRVVPRSISTASSGESSVRRPKQYWLRCGSNARGRLATGGDRSPVSADDAGFASHEVFTRAFGRNSGHAFPPTGEMRRANATARDKPATSH